MVEYAYDTWGKKVTTTGTLAGTLGLFQPFRYRGYVYDYETGLYYLQSRYYDPTTGRFISADVMLSTGQGVLGHNCYAYCLDNPVMMTDIRGYAPDNDDDKNDDDNKHSGLIYKVAIIFYMYNFITIISTGTEENPKGRIEIDLAHNEHLKEWVDNLSEKEVARMFMKTAKLKYKSIMNSDFPQTDAGMTAEIRDHIGGYLYSQSYRFIPPIGIMAAKILGRISNIEESCKTIDLDPDTQGIEKRHYGYTN